MFGRRRKGQKCSTTRSSLKGELMAKSIPTSGRSNYDSFAGAAVYYRGDIALSAVPSGAGKTQQELYRLLPGAHAFVPHGCSWSGHSGAGLPDRVFDSVAGGLRPGVGSLHTGIAVGRD